jgi:hypothetical protein
MPELLKKIPYKAGGQAELSAREIIHEQQEQAPSVASTLMSAGLSCYDKVRTLATASTLFTDAYIYKTGRVAGRATAVITEKATAVITEKALAALPKPSSTPTVGDIVPPSVTPSVKKPFKAKRRGRHR